MAEIGGIATLGNAEKVKSLNTSAYDSITEVISHGIKHFQKLDEFFTGKVGKKGHDYSFCYPTVLLNYAKTGPCEEAYKLRDDILSEISKDRWRQDSLLYVMHMLDVLNIAYPFVYTDDSCAACNMSSGANIRSLNLYDLSRDDSVWKDYSGLQARLDRYFGPKTKQCNMCKRIRTCYSLDVAPILCINVENLYESIYERGSPHLQKIFHSKMVRTSLDNLPPRLVIRGSVYVLYGVIERTPGEKEQDPRYAAFCRNPGNKWERSDGFEVEKKQLTELSVDAIALIFYADIGYWDKSERKMLLEPAKSAWNHLTNIDLPDLCLEGILSFLDNKQLKVLIEGDKEKGLGDGFTRSSTEVEEDKISVFSLDSRSSEYTRHRWRLCNVLIYSLPLSEDVSDVDRVKSLFDGIPDVDLDNILVRRCNKRPETGEYPPTVVTFLSHFEAKNIIMRKKSFPKSIKVCRDFTKWQRNRYKKLMAVAEKHNKANPNAKKFVRYIDGIPTLVKYKNSSHRNAKASLTTNE